MTMFIETFMFEGGKKGSEGCTKKMSRENVMQEI